MIHGLSKATVLVAVGVALLVAPAAAPLDPVLVHETRDSTFENETTLEAQGYTIVAYENLSERGQEHYRRTLENDGRYTVPRDRGATDFAYPTANELGDTQGYRERDRLTTVVIERPPDADLPPPDERTERAERLAEETNEEASDQTPFSNMSESEIRQQIARYDMMQTRTEQPDPTSRPALARFAAAVLGILGIGVCGYLTTKP